MAPMAMAAPSPPAEDGEQDGLGQELDADVALGGAQCTSQRPLIRCTRD
jgi:hypothetical protein